MVIKSSQTGEDGRSGQEEVHRGCIWERAAPAALAYVQITHMSAHPGRPDHGPLEERTAKLRNANIWAVVALSPKPY